MELAANFEGDEENPHQYVQCGFCLQIGSNMNDPRLLPCTHAHCCKCLLGYYDLYKVLRCPLLICGQVYDATVDTLPAHPAMGENSSACTNCSNLAVMFCTLCSEKLCTHHELSHDKTHSGHPKVTIEEYLQRRSRLQKGECEKHVTLRCTTGCSVCLITLCDVCTTELKESCCDGEAHRLKPLEELVGDLMKEVNQLKADILNREEDNSKLFKKTSEVLAEYNTETKELIRTLHRVRDEQMTALHQKYNELETDLIERRDIPRENVKSFMENEVSTRVLELYRCRRMIDAALETPNQAEVMAKYNAIKDKVATLMSQDYPELQVKGQISLEVNESKRDVEVKMSFARHRRLDIDGLTVPRIPHSLSLVASVDMPASKKFNSITDSYYYEGITYLSRSAQTIDIIDNEHKYLGQRFVLGFETQCFTVYDDRIYVMQHGSRHCVLVYNLQGKRIDQWNYYDFNKGTANMLAIVNGQVIIADRANQQVNIYSLNGEIRKQFPCSLISDYELTICSAGRESVIMTDVCLHKIFRFSLLTGEVVWLSTAIRFPKYMASYRDKYVLVSCLYEFHNIWVLDIETGERLFELVDPLQKAEGIPASLQIHGDTLLRQDHQTIRYYKLR